MSRATAAPQHMIALDGLRGLAAMVVMVHHMGFWTKSMQFEHAVLAVDFFFILSGFVIAQAYEERLKSSMSFGRFAVLRTVRLYPMIIFATLIAVIGALISTRPGDVNLSGADIVQAAGFAMLGLPSPPWVSRDTFPLNPPEWSLFFEIVANFVYAAFIFRLGNRTLAVVIAGVLLLYAFLSRHYVLNVGFLWNDFGLGFVRVALPYLLGVAIYRLRSAGFLPPWRSPLWLLALALLAVLIVPHLGRVDRVFWLIAVAIAFPILVFLATQARPQGEKLAQIGADISYPLYLIHYPMLVLLVPLLQRTGLSMTATMWCSGLIIMVTSWLVSHHYDRPVRTAILSRLNRSRSMATPDIK
jgi:peptidoglycan/LPS O-acetylase OafA/YrhL